MSKSKSIPTLDVKASQDSRWRAGRQFTREVVQIPLSELSDEERAALEADPLLSVTAGTMEVEAGSVETSPDDDTDKAAADKAAADKAAADKAAADKAAADKAAADKAAAEKK